jgi:hypothetical protein
VIFSNRSSQEPLLSFDKVQSVLRSRNYAFQGLQSIPLQAVVGSEGRAQDFARDFRPQGHHLSRIRQLSQNGTSDPIEVFQMDQVYFVRDGHHRVALARSRGETTIQALVTEITVRAEITAELAGDEVMLRAQMSHFLQETNLDEHCPLTDFRLNQPELYASLREHIEVHRYYLGSEYQREFTLVEAAASWHDLIYRPLLQVLHESGAPGQFPRRTEAELYLWITYHREELRCRGEYQGDAAVAAALVERFSERPLQGFVKRAQRVWRAAWKAAREKPEPPAK